MRTISRIISTVSMMQLKTISIEEIELRPGNPRSTFATETLSNLERSLKRDGLIQPIVVRPKGNKYELIVGERRIRAAIRANMSKLQVIVREDLSDAESDRLRLIENLQRDELTFLERVRGIEVHMQQHGIKTLQEASVDLNLDSSVVESWFKVARNIPQTILGKDEYVRRLGLQKLAEIIGYDDSVQEKLAEQIYKSNLTVDQVRRFMGLFKNNPDADLEVLAKKAQEQVKTVEVTLPIDEAEALEKHVKELRLKEEKASEKLGTIRKKPKSRKQIEQEIISEPQVSRGIKEDPEIIPISSFASERLRESEIIKEIRNEELSSEEVKMLNILKTQYPQDSARQLVDRVKERTRSQVMVVEWDAGIYHALKKCAEARNMSDKETVKSLVEEGLERGGFWKKPVAE